MQEIIFYKLQILELVKSIVIIKQLQNAKRQVLLLLLQNRH